MEKNLAHDVKKLIGARTSHRKFEDREIPREVLDQIIDASRAAPTSRHGQDYSIVVVTDKALKKELSVIIEQPYIDGAAAMLVYISDFSRTASLSTKDEENAALDYLNPLLTSNLDVGLAMYAANIQAEAFGIGGTCIGVLRYNLERNDRTGKIAKLLNLPKYSYAVCGLILGYKVQKINPKPRITREGQIFYNQYDQGAYARIKDQYDAEIMQYYKDNDLERFAKPWTKNERNFYIWAKTDKNPELSPPFYPVGDVLLFKFLQKQGLMQAYRVVEKK